MGPPGLFRGKAMRARSCRRSGERGAGGRGWGGSARGEQRAKGSGAASSADVLRPVFLSWRRDKGPLSVTVSGRDHPLHLPTSPPPSPPPLPVLRLQLWISSALFFFSSSLSLIRHLPRLHIGHLCDITGEKPSSLLFFFPLLLQEKCV